MGKKLKFIPFFFKTLSSDSWPLCSSQPKTLSFRAAAPAVAVVPAADFTIDEGHSVDEDAAAVLRGLKAKDRLFFEPEETSSILNPPVMENEPVEDSPADDDDDDDDALIKGSLITPMDSMEPLNDFRRSMEEMVEAHGLTDWTKLEELLGLYLTVNEKSNHGYIVGAFADLLIGICFAPSSSSSPPPPPPAMTSSLRIGSEEEDDRRNSSMSTSMSCSPTSAMSFSSSSSSSNVQSSLALIEPDDDEDDEIQIKASSASTSHQ
ncbi:transcription repressor OFP15-like [Impatiens glandulifera]|uniref:transcription repressor OFP15-like n=1 Tax=Impatiens glandulifera TaxID=253017 RepID=UPI001FB12CC9|nr:transcription repressor OFP15-like [Impatiens glandulifera]